MCKLLVAPVVNLEENGLKGDRDHCGRHRYELSGGHESEAEMLNPQVIRTTASDGDQVVRAVLTRQPEEPQRASAVQDSHIDHGVCEETAVRAWDIGGRALASQMHYGCRWRKIRGFVSNEQINQPPRHTEVVQGHLDDGVKAVRSEEHTSELQSR